MRLARVCATALICAAGLAAPAEATPPGANGTIVVAGPPGEIFAIDTPGGSVRQVTSTGGAVPPGAGCCFVGAAVSPNGQTIAYFTGAGIFTVPASGGPSTQVSGTTGGDVDPNWSPDGSKLVYTCATGLCTIPVAGGAPTALTGTIPMDQTPEFKPDGSEIAFLRPGATNLDIFRIPAAGGSPTQVTSGCPAGPAPTGCVQPTYSPDGSKIAFAVFTAAGCGSGTSSIAAVPSGGGSQTTIVPAAAGRDPIHPSWSPDGTQIAFQDCFSGAISSVPSSGGSITTVAAAAVGAVAPNWGVAANGTTPPVTGNPNAPTFSSPTCGAVVGVPAIGAGSPISVRASDADAGQSVTLSASGLPAWASLTSTPGNPANGTITTTPDLLTWALGSLGDLASSIGLTIPGLPSTTARVTLTATDNGTPARTATCALTLRMQLFQGSPV